MGIIYKIKCDLDTESNGYVGLTNVTINKRWNQHKTDFNYYINGNAPKNKRFLKYLCEAVKKYGVNNFKITQIEECDESLLDEREIYWVNTYNTLYPNGYNNQSGGRSGKQSKETKELISIKTKIGIHENIDKFRTYDISKNLPTYISYYIRKDRAKHTHGFNIIYRPSKKRKTVMTNIDNPITDDMLEMAKVKLQELIDDYENSLLKCLENLKV